MPARDAFTALQQALQTQNEDYARQDPHGSVQLALEQLRSAMPEEVKKTTVKPMNRLERRLFPLEKAITYPWNRIKYNANDAYIGPHAENRDILAHELTHIGQFAKKGWKRFIPDLEMLLPYDERSYEKEAFDIEARHRRARRDIPLPAENK